MGHADELNKEVSDLESFMRRFVHDHGAQLESFWHRKSEVLEDFFDTADRKAAAVDWCGVFRDNMR